jgi:hypothetical protein
VTTHCDTNGETCDAESRITRSLLGWGAIAAPLYLATVLAQMFTRDGYHLERHAVSLLTNGQYGWIQRTNFILTGLMVIAGAIGARRALRNGIGAAWAPRLLALYGLAMIPAGLFIPDPMNGFPKGAPVGMPAHATWHSNLHFAFASASFAALIATCAVMTRRWRVTGEPGWSNYSAGSAAALLGATIALAANANHGATNLLAFIAITFAMGWVSIVSIHLSRAVGYATRNAPDSDLSRTPTRLTTATG